MRTHLHTHTQKDSQLCTRIRMRARTVLKDGDTDEDGDVNVISAFDLFRCPRQALFEFVVFAKLN